MSEGISAKPTIEDSSISKSIEDALLTTESIFNLFSIFFISTVSLILTVSLSALKVSFSLFGQDLFVLPFSVFFGGYLVIFVFVVLYYVVRFSKAIRLIYVKHERAIKILALIVVVLITAIVGSILSVNEDTTMKIIGTAIIVFVVALLFIIIEPVIAPIRQTVENWINKKKSN
jgi:hypothetical protein